MSKYDKMIEENQRKSKEKIELALQAIQDMLANKERISVPKLMKKTGLSRGFFYKNPTVRDTLNQAVEQQAGMIDPRREILNMAMEKQIELLNQKVAALSRENKELKRKNEKLQKALRKQDLNLLRTYNIENNKIGRDVCRHIFSFVEDKIYRMRMGLFMVY